MESRKVVIYTVDGAYPGHSIHLICARELQFQSFDSCEQIMTPFPTDCKSSFHNNFYVHKGMRYYYGSIPNFIQVGDHQFVEHTVIRNWIDLMLCGW